MALYANQRASIKQARSSSPIPERNVRIILSSDIDLTQNELQGKLVINNLCSEVISIAGIFVRFEINEFIKYDSKFDGRSETKVRSENLLSKESWATIYVLGEDANVCKLTLAQGRTEYPFSFNLEEGKSQVRQFPASFRSPNGTIVYQVAAYIQRPYPNDQVYYQKLLATVPVDNRGYFNLSEDPTSNNLIAAEKGIQKSFFSKRCSFKALLQIGKTGFLPGEIVPFTISMNNISGEPVTKATASLIRRITWKTNTDSKNTISVLDSKSIKDVGRELDDSWSDVLKIPIKMGPTAAGYIEFQYLVKIEILVAERVPLKQETPILVGTTWGDARTDNALRQPEKFTNPIRQSSIETMQSVTFPPNYSALSSRKSSIETLPPGYEDALSTEVEDLSLPSPTEEDEEAEVEEEENNEETP